MPKNIIDEMLDELLDEKEDKDAELFENPDDADLIVALEKNEAKSEVLIELLNRIEESEKE